MTAAPLKVPLSVPARILVLIGGGEFSFGDTREIDEFLVRQMPENNRTVAFLPTASGSTEYAAHLAKHLLQIDPSIELLNVPIYRHRDARRQKNMNHLLTAGMIYLGGGVTNTLLEPLRESPAEMALRDAAERGAVIAAIGASASCFGSQVRDMRGHIAALPGLGWLTNTVVESGFDRSNDTMMRRLMSTEGTELGIGIPAGTALAIHADQTTEVIGTGTIAAFRKPSVA